MNFTGIPLWAVGAIAAGSAAILGVLHMLRVRRRQVPVITTLFWQEAAEESLARSLLQRLRYPLTWLLLTLIACLIAFALGQPAGKKSEGSAIVIVLDTGPSMGIADGYGGVRFDAAKKMVNRLSSSKSGQVAIIVTNPQPRMLVGFGQVISSLTSQLDSLKPAGPSSDRYPALSLARVIARSHGDARIVLVTDRPMADVGEDVTIAGVGKSANNAAVVSGQFVEDPANPLIGTFRCRVQYWGKADGKITARFYMGAGADLKVLEGGGSRTLSHSQTATFAAPSVNADGSVIRVEISGEDDSLASDSELVFRLPDRKKIKIASMGIMPKPIIAVINASPEMEIVDAHDDADVLILTRAGAVAGGKPSLIVTGSSGNASSDRVKVIAVPSEFGITEGLDFEGALGLGDSSLSIAKNITPLIQAGKNAVAVLDNRSPVAVARIAASLLAPNATATKRPAMAVFINRLMRHLAGFDEQIKTLTPELYLAGGLAGEKVNMLPSNRTAGDLSADMSQGLPSETAILAGRSIPIWQILLALAMALVVVESILHIRGKIA